jgi:hypothetical protein
MSSHRKPPKPEFFDSVPKGTCRWCNEPILELTPTGRTSTSRWHKGCLDQYLFMTRPKVYRRAIFKRDMGVCQTCGWKHTSIHSNWELDHITPLVESRGLEEIDYSFWQEGNLQVLCSECHKEKTSREATVRAAVRKILKEKTG